MSIGLYFGSFNPIHIGHLIIANHVLNTTGIKKIWFVISPQNPFKASGTLLNEYDRLHLLQKAIEGDTRLKAVDIEFSLPKPSYTAVTLGYLAEKYPGEDFQILMGSDSFQNLARWQNAMYIIKNHKILVYRRPGFDVQDTYGAQLEVLDAPLLEISATYIRNMVQQGKSIRYLVPPAIEEEILANRFFKA
jgi:nicotinate-nucleotide adenylyltransferase